MSDAVSRSGSFGNRIAVGKYVATQKANLLDSDPNLAYGGVGYSGVALPAQNFYIFKRVPITASLTEHDFLNALNEVESAAHAVGIVFGIATRFDFQRANPWPKLPTA